MKKIIVGALMLCLSPVVNAEEIDCKVIADSGAESMSDYFEEIEGAEPLGDIESEKLIRKSVAAFYIGSYSPDMTLKEVDELGETVGVNLVKGKNGKSYVSVNVGFGGGNSATYYYLPGTLSFVPVMSYDGECVEQGQSEEFPVERDIAVERIAELVCTFEDDAVFGEVSVKIPLGPNGLLFNSSATATVAQPRSIIRRLEIATPPPQAVNISYDEKAKTVGFNLEANAKKAQTDWKVSVAARLSESGSHVFGKAYPLVVGGYHSRQARDYRAIGICHGTLGIEKVEYNRVVNF